MTTAQAAEQLGVSRFHAAEMVKTGALDGYGIPADKRTRWYVYVDALPMPSSTADATTERQPPTETAAALRRMRDHIKTAQEERLEATALLRLASDATTFATEASATSPLEVIRSINDSERRNHIVDKELAAVRNLLDELLDVPQVRGSG